MMATVSATPDQVRLELVEGPRVAPAPGEGEDAEPEPSPSQTTLAPPGLRLPKVAVTPQEVTAGGTVQIALTEMNADQPVRVVLRPGGTVLADWVADEAGSVSSSVTLPAALAAGNYTLAFVFHQEGPEDFDLGTAPLKVTAGAASVPRSSTDLPQTGSGSAVAGVSAGLLALVGLGLALRRRRAID
jgi:LPXTG-motif cell wall-anchored protein